MVLSQQVRVEICFEMMNSVNIVRAILSEKSKTLGLVEGNASQNSRLTIRNFFFNMESSFTFATSAWPAKQTAAMCESRTGCFLKAAL